MVSLRSSWTVGWYLVRYLNVVDIWCLWPVLSSDRVQMFDLASLQFSQSWCGYCVIIRKQYNLTSFLNLKKLKRSENLSNGGHCHHHDRGEKERWGLIWKIVCQPIYQMVAPPLSHFPHKHKPRIFTFPDIYIKSMLLGWLCVAPLVSNSFFASRALKSIKCLYCVYTRLHLGNIH